MSVHALHFFLFVAATLFTAGICLGVVAAWLSFRPNPAVDPIVYDDSLDRIARLDETAAHEFVWNTSRWM